jgi:hypothetical protein
MQSDRIKRNPCLVWEIVKIESSRNSKGNAKRAKCCCYIDSFRFLQCYKLRKTNIFHLLTLDFLTSSYQFHKTDSSPWS